MNKGIAGAYYPEVLHRKAVNEVKWENAGIHAPYGRRKNVNTNARNHCVLTAWEDVRTWRRWYLRIRFDSNNPKVDSWHHALASYLGRLIS